MRKIEILGRIYERKMNRREFTRNIAKLILEMIEAGDMPIIDYALRSAEEQQRLYRKGVSGCDGYIKKSSHQLGKAVDIYLVRKRREGSIYIDYNWSNEEKARKWHSRWVELGGKKMITFKNKLGHVVEDRPHFEG